MNAFLYLLRKTKGLSMRMNIHFLVGPFEHFLTKLSLTSRMSRWRKEHEKEAGFNDFYSSKFDHDKRYGMYQYLIEQEGLSGEIDYLEFGVAQGHAFKWWLSNNTNPGSRFYGFDTFTGLPEDWGHFKKGAMSSGNKLPEVNDSRATFYQGLFQQTLPGFLKSYTPSSSRRKIIHMDADLYSSTLYVLTSIHGFINPGDIVLFDEFNVPMHEFKAFHDYVDSYYTNYKLLGAVNNYYQAAFKIV